MLWAQITINNWSKPEVSAECRILQHAQVSFKFQVFDILLLRAWCRTWPLAENSGSNKGKKELYLYTWFIDALPWFLAVFIQIFLFWVELLFETRAE